MTQSMPERRCALVTGAGSGIGLAVAERLAARGDRVVVSDIRVEAAEKAAERLRESGSEAVSAPGDVSKPDEVERIVERARAAYGAPEVLVNSAGFLQQAKFVDLGVEDFDRMIAVHLRGTFLCTRAVLPDMLSRGKGAVVNVSSQLGQIGGIDLCHYSAAKAGIIGLTKSLAREVSSQGVRVNAVAPGPVNTELIAGLTPEWRSAKEAELPLGRFGEPHEVAASVAFLASDDASLYVGQTLGPNSGDVML